ncbi:MAG: endonuclease [Lentisphaeria bacterium]|nr:endonuclease [Lentisphaeria bacterium]
MRLLVYNIAYGTGCPGGEAKRLLTAHRYLRTSAFHFGQIVGLVNDLQPDMIGLVEADSGSWRTAGLSHPDLMAQMLNEVAETGPATGSKYGPSSFLSRFPYLKSQTNALLGRSDAAVRTHYFPCGTKKLILERECDGITVFLVHLGLTRRTRARQIAFLRGLLPKDRPIVLAGDFNTFRGESELTELEEELGLINANASRAATYPAWKPLKQLDYILVSRRITVEHFEVLPVLYSDHLPLVADLTL